MPRLSRETRTNMNRAIWMDCLAHIRSVATYIGSVHRLISPNNFHARLFSFKGWKTRWYPRIRPREWLRHCALREFRLLTSRLRVNNTAFGKRKTSRARSKVNSTFILVYLDLSWLRRLSPCGSRILTKGILWPTLSGEKEAPIATAYRQLLRGRLRDRRRGQRYWRRQNTTSFRSFRTRWAQP